MLFFNVLRRVKYVQRDANKCRKRPHLGNTWAILFLPREVAFRPESPLDRPEISPLPVRAWIRIRTGTRIRARMKNCPFCNAAPSSRWLESESAVALWDGYPISEGHTLVVPRLHVASLFDLPPAEIAAVWAFVSRVRGELAKRFQVESFTIGLNDGLPAGQTVMHAHVHVVPRREGDVPDPRGGIRWVIQEKAAYWTRSP